MEPATSPVLDLCTGDLSDSEAPEGRRERLRCEAEEEWEGLS